MLPDLAVVSHHRQRLRLDVPLAAEHRGGLGEMGWDEGEKMKEIGWDDGGGGMMVRIRSDKKI